MESAELDAQRQIARGRPLEKPAQRRRGSAETDKEAAPQRVFMSAADEETDAVCESLRRIGRLVRYGSDTHAHLGGQSCCRILEERLKRPEIAVDRAARHTGRFGEVAHGHLRYAPF